MADKKDGVGVAEMEERVLAIARTHDTVSKTYSQSVQP
jgi:hypothetical protein